MPALTLDVLQNAMFGENMTNYPVFIETGTLNGETLEALMSSFRELYSVDIDPNALARAKKRLPRANNIHLILGDSVEMLPKLLRTKARKMDSYIGDTPTIYFLDAHYSGNASPTGKIQVPIYEELRTIMTICSSSCIVIIDYFRLFGKIGSGGDDWRAITEKQATNIVSSRLQGVKYLSSPLAEQDRLVFKLGPQ